MDVTLSPKPLVPVYPIQQDRQPDYPRSLGPVFIGNPYRVIPEARPRTGTMDAAAPLDGGRASAGTGAPVARSRSPALAGAPATGGTPRAPGALVDLLA